ncbi:hypothetical protein COLO4_12986 [Corchorus olitorius]|uniref:KIB1-4 beta-propeller domain-containing protein n=1 Tax=Corchorus olitorius TaxID=93759 RepID=A0A1R3JYT0_9ROSI|nr:hypothetical protein COLO4_12986 [Corchorus olitorius]
MAILSPMRLLGFAKPGDQAWTTIDVAAARLLEDVMYFNGSFFAVHNHGHLLICQDLDGPSPKAIEFAKSPSAIINGHDEHYGEPRYLVDLDGSLCMIVRRTGLYDHYNDDNEIEHPNLVVTEGFEIFKLDMHTRGWEKIFSLGDRCLFLGNCCTFSVLASDYPGCVANCIYFTDDHVLYNYGEQSKGFDTGIYNGANKKVLHLPTSGDVHEFRSQFCPPLWIHPSSH